jgi:hypothetical protein
VETFKISAEEVKTLLNEAPAELRARLTADATTSSVNSLSFEFSSAALLRPWFVSDAFRARFWRFGDASKLISDGGTPPSGECPAYATAIVFARRVTVDGKQTQTEQGNAQVFDGFGFTVATGGQGEQLVSSALSDALQVASSIADQAVAASFISAHHPLFLRRLAFFRLEYGPDTCLPGYVWREAFPGDHVCVTEETRAQAAYDNSQALARRVLAGSDAAVAGLQDEQTAGPVPTPSTVKDEPIYILAFISKALPRCPNPDPTLQW